MALIHFLQTSFSVSLLCNPLQAGRQFRTLTNEKQKRFRLGCSWEISLKWADCFNKEFRI